MPLIKKCGFCGKNFKTKVSLVRRGGGKYCSRKCAHGGLKTGEERRCYICGKVVYRKPLQIIRSISKKFFCSKSCQTIWRNEQFVGPKHASWKEGLHTYKRVLLQSGKPEKCILCSTKDVRVLAVHHIDKDHHNNQPSNLEWLCHNCHFLVHHYSEERKKFMETLV